MKRNIFFISEVSSNHSQDIERALKFIDQSASIGCSAVKFQLFKIEKLFSKEVLDNNPETLKRKKWELPLEFIPVLAKRCLDKKIQFSCTPFYIEAVNELKHYVNFFKIASYELLWDDLLIACAKTKKPLVLSTGMATMNEIKHAVEIVKKNGCRNLTILHCTSAYPTPHNEANLAAIQTLRKKFNCSVGWSDHTVNPGVINRAINKWGAEVIEFHMDLEGDGDEFNTGHCWLPNQIALVINQVKDGFSADGDGVKTPVNSEKLDRLWRADPSDGLRPIKSIRKKLKKK
jgi:sialic acid synthase SpsE